jgi:hypothetical protein
MVFEFPCNQTLRASTHCDTYSTTHPGTWYIPQSTLQWSRHRVVQQPVTYHSNWASTTSTYQHTRPLQCQAHNDPDTCHFPQEKKNRPNMYIVIRHSSPFLCVSMLASADPRVSVTRVSFQIHALYARAWGASHLLAQADVRSML